MMTSNTQRAQLQAQIWKIANEVRETISFDNKVMVEKYKIVAKSEEDE